MKCLALFCKGLFLLFVIFNKNNLLSQVRTYSTSSQENILHRNIENKFQLLIEGVNCEEIDLFYNSKKLKREECYFYISIDSNQSDFLNLYIPNTNDTITFFVFEPPQPNIFFYNFWHHNYRCNYDSLVYSLNSFYNEIYTSIIYEIGTYDLILIDDDQTIYERHIKANNLNDIDKKCISKLNKGDKIFLSNIEIFNNGKLLFKMNQTIDIPEHPKNACIEN